MATDESNLSLTVKAAVGEPVEIALTGSADDIEDVLLSLCAEGLITHDQHLAGKQTLREAVEV